MRTEKAQGERSRVDPAVARAREVVGLYGDASVSWSIMVDIELTRPVLTQIVQDRAKCLVAEYPSLGRMPALRVFGPHQLKEVLHTFANDKYGDSEPLTRIALSDTGTRLVLAVHHGAMDGLGLIAALSYLLDSDLSSSARGVPEAVAHSGFLGAAAKRLLGALWRPPVRFDRARSAESVTDAGDWVFSGPVRLARPSTGALVAATRRALADWNVATASRRPVVIAVGASRRRAAEPLRPDRCTAYARLVADEAWTRESATKLLARTPPEPEFPATRVAGIGPVFTRLFASRLGATALVSNVGRLSGSDLVARAHFYPAASGPCGVAIGMASVNDACITTVRVKRADFDETAARRLFDTVSRELSSPDQ